MFATGKDYTPKYNFDIKYIFENKIYNQMKQSVVNPINSSPHRAAGEKGRWVKEQKRTKEIPTQGNTI